MDKINPKFHLIFLTVLLVSCIAKGYDNKYGMYVPKKPKFKLKNKPFHFPANLDTINVYKKVYREYLGKVDFLVEDNLLKTDNDKIKSISYLKFYPEGRTPHFMTRTLPSITLTENDLNPNFATQGYYFYDGRKIFIETFVYGEGYGRYIMFNYFLNENGDSLTTYYGNSKTIYIREIIPKNWKKYSVDW